MTPSTLGKALDLLTKARASLNKPLSWKPGSLAHDHYGGPCSIHSEKAVRFSIRGALLRGYVYDTSCMDVVPTAYEALMTNTPSMGPWIDVWESHPSRMHYSVLDAFDRAIQETGMTHRFQEYLAKCEGATQGLDLDAIAQEYCQLLEVHGGMGDVASFCDGHTPWYKVTMKDGRVFRRVAVQGSGGVFRNESGERVLRQLLAYKMQGHETNLIIGVSRWFGNQSFPVNISDIVSIVADEPKEST